MSNIMKQYHTMGYLHTNADRFNRPAAYNILKQQKKANNHSIIRHLTQQKKHMIEIETKFYNSLGYRGQDFGGFINWLKNLVPKNDRMFLTEFSSTLKNQNLYDYYKKELSKEITGITSQQYDRFINTNYKLPQELGDLKNNKNRLFTIEIKKNASKAKIKKMQNVVNAKGIEAIQINIQDTINSYLKNLATTPINSSNNIFSTIFEETINQLEIARIELLKEYDLYTKSDQNFKKINREVVFQQLQPLFINLLQQQGFDKKTSIDLLEVGVLNFKALQKMQKGRGRKTHGTEADELYRFFINKMNRYNCTEELKRAFQFVWQHNRENINASIRQTSSNFIGGIGELSGMILLYYIKQKTGNDKLARDYVNKAWTGQEMQNGEQMRADIMLNKISGIQVKNYQQSTITSGTVEIKLHPYQVLERLVQNGEIAAGSREYKEWQTAFANMSFNRTSFELFQTSIEVALKPFVASLANFSTQVDNIIPDTTNIWLIGGSFLIPGSEILQLIIDTFQDKISVDYKTISLSSTATQTDETFKQHPEKVQNYWLLNKQTDLWESTEENEEQFNNLLHSNKLSTKVTFDLSSFIYSKNNNFRKKYRVF